MKISIRILAFLFFASIITFGQATTDRKEVMEKYDEVSRLETLGERRAFLGKQTEEMKVALWNENIDRKTKGVELTSEQKEILDVIRKKYNTVEFVKSVRGKNEADAGKEYAETMSKASQILGKESMREWFGILGDSKTLKKE